MTNIQKLLYRDLFANITILLARFRVSNVFYRHFGAQKRAQNGTAI